MAFSKRQAELLRILHSALGTPYVWGGTSLKNGVDCSGLIYAAALKAGIRGVPRTSQQQFAAGTPVQMNGLRPGDLVFSNWGSEVGAGHVSIYIGHGKIIEAAGQGIPVRIANMSVLSGHILGARRYMAGAGQALPNVSVFAQKQLQYHAQQTGQPMQAPRPIQLPQQPAVPSAQSALMGGLRPSQPLETPLSPAQPGAATLASGAPSTTSQLGALDSLHSKLLNM